MACSKSKDDDIVWEKIKPPTDDVVVPYSQLAPLSGGMVFVRRSCSWMKESLLLMLSFSEATVVDRWRSGVRILL